MSAQTLWDLVVEGAGRVPGGKSAVLSTVSGLSFEELVEGALSVAATLHEAGIGKGDRVGIWMDKTPRCVQTLLGTMAAGAAYVPLDPRAPWRRCRAIAADCGFKALAVDAPRMAKLRDLLEGLPVRLLLADSPEGKAATEGAQAQASVPYDVALKRPASVLPSAGPDDVAYILYTSGSTGVPKGVVHTHRSGLAFANWIIRRFDVTDADVFSSHAPFHFDLSISDLYASLGSGASVRLISGIEGMLAPWLVRMIAAWGITVWYSVPSILIAMLETGLIAELGLPTLRVLFFAGEVFPTPQLRRLRRAIPKVPLFNLFGPTETNVCTYYEVPPDIPDEQTSPIPIGRACEHMETFVIGDAGELAGVGTEGTLWASGPNLMQGYWNDPERNAATLRGDPRGGNGIAYCTGDRVVLQPDGQYQFRGRRDHMVKIRGYRIELGEVEAALSSHPDVLEAVAVPLDDCAAGMRLVATVLARSGTRPDPESLRNHLRLHVPTYMVPEQIEVLSALPRTSTGKIDRTALRSAWESKGGS